MDRRSWPWKKKSSDKVDKVAAANAAAAAAAAAVLPSAAPKVEQQDNHSKPKYVQISVESYTHLTGLEDQVKNYEEHVQDLEDQIKDFEEKLSAAHSEMTTKDDLVKQHSKVAEEAVSGWEKAEAEALALKNHLESVTLSKLTAEDRAAHLDGALKECMRQIRNLKEEHEQKLQEFVLVKTKQWDKNRIEFETKVGKLDHELLKSAAENAALSRSLQERSNMLINISEEKSRAEGEIELLKNNVESCEREINSLKYELHVASKEMEICNEEKNMSMRSAEVANRQYAEGVKKIAKLEAECQRLRGLVRKKLPGPAALAQMKLEVEILGRDYGETRHKRSPVKASSPSLSPVTEFSLDNVQKFQKENEFLTERLLAMEEETKMLKEALAKRNSELQASRNLCAKTASKLQGLESQVHLSSQHKSYSSQNASNPPSLTSMSEEANDDQRNDDERSCSDSSAIVIISELSHVKNEQNTEKSNKPEKENHLELMDDFLEMEKLAYLSNDSNASGAITVTDSLDNNTSEDSQSRQKFDLEISSDHLPSNKDMPLVTSGTDTEPLLRTSLKSKISMVFDSMSNDADTKKIVEDIKRIILETQDALHTQSFHCASEEVLPSNSEDDNAVLTLDKEIPLLQASSNDSETGAKLSLELANAISQINDFILLLGKEAVNLHEMSSDCNELSQKIIAFSTTSCKISSGGIRLDEIIFDLSHVLAKASNLRFSVLGFKNGDSEPSSPDCIDKVALPENKMDQKDLSGERYQNGSTLVSSPTSNPEIPDDGRLVSHYDSITRSCKFTLEDFEELRSEKVSMATDLGRLTENLERTRSQLHETEHILAEVKLQLASAHKSNSLSETQLKCMAESYRLLESRTEELETEIKLLQAKTEKLENELRDERNSHQDALERCQELQEQLQRNKSCSVCSSAADNDLNTQQDRELSAAAVKLAECQETMFLLGKQLNSLRPPTEYIGSPYNERIEKSEELSQYFDQAETDPLTSPNLQRIGAESPIDSYNQSDTQPDLLNSPISSKYPKHRTTKSGSSSCSSTPTPEKQSRGFSRFFSSKGTNSQ